MVDFRLMNAPDIGGQFSAGMQDARNALAAQEERQVRRMQMSALADQRTAAAEDLRVKTEDRRAQMEESARRQQWLATFGQKLKEGGYELNDQTLALMTQAPEPEIRQLGLKGMQELTAERRFREALAGAQTPEQKIEALTPLAANPRVAPVMNALQKEVDSRRREADQNADRERQRMRDESDVQIRRAAMEAAAAARAARAARGSGGGGGAPNLVGEVGKGIVEIVDPETGQARVVSRAEAVRLGAITAKEAAAGEARDSKSAKSAEAVRDMNTLLNEIETNYSELDRRGGMVRAGGSPIANTLTSAMASGPGQIAGRTVGTQNQTFRDNIQNLRLRLLNAMKNAEGTGVGSLNSNMELKTYIDSLGNVNQSRETIDATLKAIRKIVANTAAQAEQAPTAPAAPAAARPAAPAKAPAAGKSGPTVSNW